MTEEDRLTLLNAVRVLQRLAEDNVRKITEAKTIGDAETIIREGYAAAESAWIIVNKVVYADRMKSLREGVEVLIEQLTTTLMGIEPDHSDPDVRRFWERNYKQKREDAERIVASFWPRAKTPIFNADLARKVTETGQSILKAMMATTSVQDKA